MEKITAHLIGGSIYSNSKSAINLQSSQKIGEKDKDKVIYMLSEALYLVEKNLMNVFDIKNKELKNKKLLKKLLKIDKRIILKYTAYKDLKDKGLIPKTALKYGADFRIYKKKNQHSKWICFVDSEKGNLNWRDFSSKNRVAHSTKKNLLLAIVDEENDLTYYEVNWTRL
jgi:tRNA-intron endonuclease, archaea type